MQRTFIIGDKWLYYKLYSGQKTSDELLTNVIDPICDELISNGVIDSWYFIRYGDPKNHLRWRMKAKESHDIGRVIESVFNACRSYIDSGQIYKVQTDTYKRELERYGSKTIELSEMLFWHDSNMIVKMLGMVEGDEGEKIRWLFGMRAIDQLLTDFEYTTRQKYDLLSMLAESFGKEFNINSSLIIKLSDKYRKEKKDIFDFMKKIEGANHQYYPIIELLNEKSKKSKAVVNKILDINNDNDLEIQLSNLLGSYIHMLMNRLFRSKQRLHEMVIYGFLFRYYRTELAREKYNS
jgi:thiopeptide-type bacteriocin biosynthesis protein